MTRSKHILQELQEISPGLTRLEVVENPYKVPAGYFESLAELILLRIRTENVSGVEEETRLISPVLAGIRKTMPYSVPEGYFENLKTPTPEPSIKAGGPRVISLPVRKIFRYAAAAVTVGLLFLVTWFYLKEPANNVSQVATTSDFSAEEQVKINIGDISDGEIAAFVERSPVMFPLEPYLPAQDASEEDMLLMLADVSDQELEKYVEQHNSNKEKFN